ncbi:hypothetical protein Peur_048825 [Populus x canadensis]
MGEGTRLTLLMVGVVIIGRREEADYGGKELLTTKKLMDAGRRNMDDLLGGDCRGVVEINTASIRKKRLLLEEQRGS